jgi:hypothetical protein
MRDPMADESPKLRWIYPVGRHVGRLGLLAMIVTWALRRSELIPHSVGIEILVVSFVVVLVAIIVGYLDPEI